MPYITQEDRTATEDNLFGDALQFVPNNAGELNFLVSTLIDNYLTEHGVRYRHINEMIGALECCKLELYRRIASPYEDVVMAKNGDAYTQKIEGTGDY
jgi:hypothetical protein